MTLEEAKLIAIAMEDIDGGCPICIKGMCIRMNEAFPQFRFYINLGEAKIEEHVLVENV